MIPKKAYLILLLGFLKADEIIIPEKNPYIPIFTSVNGDTQEEEEPEIQHAVLLEEDRLGISSGLRKVLNVQYERAELLKRNISIILKSVKIGDAIELIGKSADLNFVVDSDVKGVVKNLSLKNVPVAAALKAILSNNSPELALRKEFGVFRILRLSKAVNFLKSRVEELKEEDYKKETVILQNAKLDKNLKRRIKGMWRGVTGKEHDKDGVYLVFDDETNKVFLRGKSINVASLIAYLEEIDIKIPQVKIEARVVIANKDFDESLGLQIAGRYSRTNKDSKLASVGALKKDNGVMDWALNLFPEVAVNKRRLNVPFVFGGGDLSTKRLNIVLNAAENRGELRTILKPSILTNHGEESEILVGNSIPIETIIKENVEGTPRDITTATYKDVGTKLRVKPEVSPNKRTVLLDIFVENSSYTMQNKFPVITSTRTKNRVRLRSGQTTMIGGLIENSKRKDSSSIPILGEIPLLGRLFRGSSKETKDHQMLIFITPRVV